MRIPLLLVPWVMLGLAGCGGSDSGPVGRPLAPVAYFLGNPRGPVDHKSSPGRTQTAFRQSSPGRQAMVMNLFVQKGSAPPVQITSGVDRNVSQFRWFNEHRLGFLRDPDGSEGFRLYGVNADGSNLVDLTPTRAGGVDTEPLWPDSSGPNRWLVAMGPTHGIKDLYWCDVETGESGLKARNPGNIHQLIRGPDGQALLGLAMEGLESSVLYRPTESTPFRPVGNPAIFPDLVMPCRLENGSHAIALSNLGRDKLVRVRMDLVDGQTARVLARDPARDVGAEEPDPGAFSSQGWQRANLGPRAEQPRTLSAEQILESEGWGVPVSYAARDGLVIHCFLHLPNEVLPAKPPAVILCHGGPAAMVGDGGNPEARFLASRGLVVLEPNFRGSAGFGKEFQAAGFGEWGRAMQDDLADGAKWLADSGLADSARIAIMGASYGGYAALAGATLHPETYCCAVAVAGPSNLVTFLDSAFGGNGAEYLRLTVGDLRSDMERLRQVSPALQAHRVRIPILLAHGARDSRVPIAESEQMVAALRAQGKPVEFLVFPEEGHSYWCEHNNLALYRAVETFLGQHLGSRVGP